MIKAAILGAETMAAGELIRILINHPDVELLTVASDTETGRRVDHLHRGLTGDTDLTLTPLAAVTSEEHDVVFLCGEPWMASSWMQLHDEGAHTQDVKVIDLTGAFRNGEYGMVYGLPEHNRKALVRGATRTSIPSAAATAVELALFPLAKNGLLSTTVNAVVSIADAGTGTVTSRRATVENVSGSTRLDPIAPIENRPDGRDAAVETTAAMRAVQPSFSGSVNLRLSRDASRKRGLTATVELSCSIPLTELQRLYDEAYSDHSFTYPVEEIPVVADVANTNKCLLNIAYDTAPDTGLPTLRITAVIDNLLKGAAGTAVHCMNLLFGLSERTGLALKASAF